MVIVTRSRRLRSSIQSVLSRIPDAERRLVTQMVHRIRTDREWQAMGVSELPSRIAGRLLPLFSRGDKACRSRAGQSMIEFCLPVCRLFSDEALAGIVSLEFARTLRAAKVGDGWYEQMERRGRGEELEAEAIATRWGFARSILAMRTERTQCVEPWISAHEAQIARRLHLMSQRRHEEAKKRFEALRKARAQG